MSNAEAVNKESSGIIRECLINTHKGFGALESGDQEFLYLYSPSSAHELSSDGVGRLKT